MNIIIDGDNASGKSTFLAYMSTLIHRPIWSTMELPKHELYEPLDMYKIITLGRNPRQQFPKGIVLFMDEAYTWLESRMSNRVENIYLSHKTNFQWRKRWLDVYLTFQDLSSIDKRYRSPIRWDIQILCKWRDPMSRDPFTYYYYRPKKNYQRRTKHFYELTFTYDEMSKYFDYFKTNEIIESPQMAKWEWDLMKNDPELKKLILNDIFDLIYPQAQTQYPDGITHPELNILLLSNSILSCYESDLYQMINQKKRL